MSTLTSLTYTRGATVNLGNYESKRLEVSATIELKEGERHDDELAKLTAWVNNKLEAEAKRKGMF